MESYSVANDFAGVIPNIEQLYNEITAETNITKQLNDINLYGDSLSIFFVSNISAPEKTSLDSVISGHVPDNNPVTDKAEKILLSQDWIKNDSYRRISKPFKFPGTTYAKASVISRMDSNLTSYDIKIYDNTNKATLIETTLNNTTESVQNLGVLTNLSSDTFVIEVFAKKNGGNTSSKIYLESITIEYV